MAMAVDVRNLTGARYVPFHVNDVTGHSPGLEIGPGPYDSAIVILVHMTVIQIRC